MRRRDVGSQEDGAVAIITAIVLTVLLALTAFVVDFGLVRTDIRQAQSAADTAALAGADELAENGDYEAACQVAVDFLAANLGATFSSTLCDDFANMEVAGKTCQSRATSGDPPGSSAGAGPIVVMEESGSYTVTIQMPVPDSDDRMGSQGVDADYDGDDPCKRMGVSVRRTRNTTFGAFAGNGGDVSGIADSVAVYEEGERLEDVPSLIVLDPTGCRVLQVSSNSGKLIVKNLDGVDTNGDPIVYPGLISVDSNGGDCGNAASDWVMRTNAAARLCAGVTIENNADFLDLVSGARDCDSEPNTLRSRSFATDRGATKPYGRAADPGQVGTNIQPEPINGRQITRQPADHEWNCRPSYPLAGDNWLPHYETAIGPCSGRAPNMDNLLDDLASGAGFATDTTWQTLSGAGCSPTGPVGDGTQNLYFNCNTLSIKNDVTINTRQYIVVKGDVDVSTAAGKLRVNYNAGTPNDRDVVMVVRGKTPGNPGVGLGVGSTSELYLHRTMVYLHEGASSIDAHVASWTAPLGRKPGATSGRAYDPDTGAPDQCTEVVDFSSYQLPSPECFQNLAMWTNNHRVHTLRGGASLYVEGVFFAPYAGRTSGAFDLAGGISQELAKAQFFTYKFDMSGSSTLVLQPDPDRNLRVRTTSVGLIR